MALSLNGLSNTIGGLAVGGVPDGTIDADALAANAVTTAKINDLNVTGGKLASGVGGKILGVASVTYDDQQRGWTQSTSWGDSGMEITYTPTASNSTAIISLNAMVYGGPSQYIFLCVRQEDGVLGGGSDDYLPIAIGNVSNWESCSASWHITPTWTAGTQTSFQIYMRRYTNSQGTVYLGWGSSTYGTYKDGLILQEVAA